MNDIFMISALWTDELENEIRSAYGYSPIGFVRTEAEAKEICKEYIDGEGWPFKRGDRIAKFTYLKVPELFKKREHK